MVVQEHSLPDPFFVGEDQGREDSGHLFMFVGGMRRHGALEGNASNPHLLSYHSGCKQMLHGRALFTEGRHGREVLYG